MVAGKLAARKRLKSRLRRAAMPAAAANAIS
jgi:hypothetical protein